MIQLRAGNFSHLEKSGAGRYGWLAFLDLGDFADKGQLGEMCEWSTSEVVA